MTVVVLRMVESMGERVALAFVDQRAIDGERRRESGDLGQRHRDQKSGLVRPASMAPEITTITRLSTISITRI